MKNICFVSTLTLLISCCEDNQNSLAVSQNNCGLETTYIHVVDSLKWPKGSDLVSADDCGCVK